MLTARRTLSYLLVAVGAFLLFQGARELWESRWGQSSAEDEFAELSTESSVVRPDAPKRGETVAKLMIPRLNSQLYVVEGVDQNSLRRGPGHMIGTAMPGAEGNVVIAGHRDTHFRVLKDIQKGDDIVIQTQSGEYLYRVKSTEIVSPKNTASIQPTKDPVLNLITCYPFYYVGSAPKRFIVEAQLAGYLDAAYSPGQ